MKENQTRWDAMDKAGTWDKEVGDMEQEVIAKVEVLKRRRRKSLAEQTFATSKLPLVPLVPSSASVSSIPSHGNQKKTLLKLQPSSKQKIIDNNSKSPAGSPASEVSGRSSGILGAEFERKHGLIRVDSSASIDTDLDLSSKSANKGPVSHRDKRTSRLRNSAREGRKSMIPRVASEWELDGNI